MLRLAVLQNVVAPTRHALFRELARRPGVELNVLFMARSEATRGWATDEELGYPHMFLRGVHLHLATGGDVDSVHLNPGAVAAVRRGSFHALLSAGYLSPTTWLALLACKSAGTRFLLWFGSSWPPEGRRSQLAAPLKRRIVRASDGFVAYGAAAREQLLGLGADPGRIRIALNTTDVRPFAAAAQERAAARGRLGLGSEPVALWVGRFVPRKRADRAVSLVARLRERVPGLRVLFVGEGPERSRAESAARAARLDARFLGDVRYDELPSIYAAADVLVTLSEREPWGLVVNEALAAGLPVLASSGVVAARELLPPGAGAVSDDEEVLAAAGARLLTSPDAVAAARAAARGVLPRITESAWANQVLAAAREAVEGA